MASQIRREDIDAVRDRARIEDVVGQEVTLKRAGVGSLKGLCPFHDEKTPSFHVRPEIGRWHCFGCGEGGDVIDFVERIHHLSFTEAVEHLAAQVGVQLTYVEGEGKRRRGIEPGTRQRLLEANRVAEAFFVSQLSPNNPDANEAGRLLYGRGFDATALAHFRVGYAPGDWDALARHLRDKGFTEDELVDSGLCSRSSNGQRVYDRFRDRIMWPIRDVTGATVGFGGRRIQDDDPTVPKYLNTPETAIYHKSSVLYGIDLAKQSIATQRQVVVVEGYTDVMAAHLSGVTTAVATCGTAFGGDHARLVRRILGDSADPSKGVVTGRQVRGGEIVFTFDGDAAGRKAALRAYGEDQRFAAQTFVAVDPNGMDPCDLRLEEGDQGIPRLLSRRIPLFEFVAKTTLSDFDLTTAEGRVHALRATAPVIAGIRDQALRREYTRLLAGWVGLPIEDARGAVSYAARQQRSAGSGEAAMPAQNPQLPTRAPVLPPATDRMALLERQVLAMMLQYPLASAEAGADNIEPAAFNEPLLRATFEAIMAAGGSLAMKDIVDALASEGSGRDAVMRTAFQQWVRELRMAATPEVDAAMTALAVHELPLSPSKRGEESIDPFDLQRFASETVRSLTQVGLNRRLVELRSQQRRLEPGSDEARKVMEEIMTLERQRQQLRGGY